MFYTGYAQTSMQCRGVKVKILEATENITTVEVDATGVSAPISVAGQFQIVNGTSDRGNKTLRQEIGIWKFNRTGEEEMILKFTSVWKGCPQMSLDPKMLECVGIKMTVIGVTESEIQLHVDGTAFGHLVQPPGSYQSQFTLENGSCIGCKGFHANNSGFDSTGIWKISNGAGTTRIMFNGALQQCEGKSLELD
jgi:hypothetical protein